MNLLLAAAVFNLLCISVGRPESGLQPGSRYYSIHLASFKNLENANRFVNSLKTKGNAVFWREADVGGKGRFFRVYLGKYADRSDAVAFWKKLDREGAVSYFGVHAFTEPEILPSPGIEPAEPGKPAQPAETEALPQPLPEPIAPGAGQRFVDNGDGTVTDTQNRLMWVKNGWRIDFFSALRWEEAMRKCRRFDLAGHKDWRLPTLNEWQWVIDRSHRYPAVVSPSPFVNIIAHMPYWTGTDYLYKIHVGARSVPSREAYTVMLYAGTVHHQKKTERAFVMPVRSMK